MSNDGTDAHTLADRIWNGNCFMGVHVIQRFVDEWTWSNYDNRLKFLVGNHHTIELWAIKGSCPSQSDEYNPNSINIYDKEKVLSFLSE